MQDWHQSTQCMEVPTQIGCGRASKKQYDYHFTGKKMPPQDSWKLMGISMNRRIKHSLMLEIWRKRRREILPHYHSYSWGWRDDCWSGVMAKPDGLVAMTTFCGQGRQLFHLTLKWQMNWKGVSLAFRLFKSKNQTKNTTNHPLSYKEHFL